MIVEMHELQCADCGMPFAITKDFERRRREDGANFYCPAGHVNCYVDSQIDQLRRERDRLKQAVARIEDEKRQIVDNAERREHNLKRQIGRGKCPCCRRTFANMARHMKTKHPEIATLPARSA